ncbi:GNAT family N-acetyltransferase [Labrenzia sp. 011]|uniref:GNAT family N-acetyltransferase n=1 Tax=Labrenzia sp. 011 TaxID=2171494 RepID=UPI000D5253DA|nr:GNAT family N-acetyltransferase [Labrenzia sp. 011]PVB61665.1 NUDIX hydrolase [Labrenzia sp. 011]
MPLKLRPATSADVLALTDILQRTKPSRAYPEDRVADLLKQWRISDTTFGTLTVAEQDGRPVGFCGMSPQDDDTLRVDFLIVAPEARSQGIGTLLLSRADVEARTRALTRLVLEPEIDAGPFCERRGFKPLATRPEDAPPGRKALMMEKRLPPAVHRVSKIDINLSPDPWPFEIANEAAIAAHFEEARKRIGLLWNGRTLKLSQFRFENGTFKGICRECSYAAFLAWRDWGAPDASARNLFGSAILRARDGELLYGVMSQHTATAGQIYPPGGNLDPSDVSADGQVDVNGAICRELEEETGLTGQDVHADDLLVAFDGPRISIARVFHIDAKAEDLRDSIRRFSEASSEQELSDIRIIRTQEDLNDPAIVSYARAIGAYLLAPETV